MGRVAPISTMKQLSEVNLTPLMDLTFILLITFIITFPLIEQGIPVNLPEAKAAPLPSEQARAVITLDESGNHFLDDDPVSFDELLERMTLRAQGDPGLTIYIRADRAIAYGDVVKILQALHERNLTRVALVTRAES